MLLQTPPPKPHHLPPHRVQTDVSVHLLVMWCLLLFSFFFYKDDTKIEMIQVMIPPKKLSIRKCKETVKGPGFTSFISLLQKTNKTHTHTQHSYKTMPLCIRSLSTENTHALLGAEFAPCSSSVERLPPSPRLMAAGSPRAPILLRTIMQMCAKTTLVP